MCMHMHVLVCIHLDVCVRMDMDVYMCACECDLAVLVDGHKLRDHNAKIILAFIGTRLL